MFDVQMGLGGQSALVAGAGKGIGRAAALGLAEAGADIAAITRSAEDLDSLAGEVEALGRTLLRLEGDVTSSAIVDDAVTQTMKRFGKIDILINAVGRNLRKPVVETTDADWHAAMLSNLTSTFYTCRAVGPGMLQRKRGCIINIASTAGVRGRPNMTSYSATKAAVINFSRALAMEWAPAGIRVNVLCPGRFLTQATAKEMNDPRKYEIFIKNVPMNRIGQPDELKPAVVWLASAASGFATGTVLVIDGGQTLL